MSALLTTSEMAKILRITPYTLIQHTKKRLITGSKIGGRWRFNRDAVLAAKNFPHREHFKSSGPHPLGQNNNNTVRSYFVSPPSRRAGTALPHDIRSPHGWPDNRGRGRNLTQTNYMSTELATTQQPQSKTVVTIGNRGIELTDMDSLVRFSGAVARSGLAPKGIEKQEAIFVAIQMGLEVGMSPMAALQNIAVINGRPSIWGDAQLAIVRRTGDLEHFEEWYEQGGQRLPRNPVKPTDDTTAVCRVKRKGYPAAEGSFSVADAKAAGLWGKSGPWTQYWSRMLKHRARSFNLRDQFGDALKGMLSAEEAQDLPPETRNVTPAGRPVESLLAPVEVIESTDDMETKPDIRSAIMAIVEAKGLTFSDLTECLVADGAISPPDIAKIKTIADVPDAILRDYLGADGAGDKLAQGLAFITENRKA